MKNGVNNILSLLNPSRITGISSPNTSSILPAIRKVTKNKGVFPSDTAFEKLVYLAYRNIRKKWTMPLANWATISQQLAIKFGDRFKLL